MGVRLATGPARCEGPDCGSSALSVGGSWTRSSPRWHHGVGVNARATLEVCARTESGGNHESSGAELLTHDHLRQLLMDARSPQTLTEAVDVSAEWIIKAAVKPVVHSFMETSRSERDQPEEEEREGTDEHSSE